MTSAIRGLVFGLAISTVPSCGGGTIQLERPTCGDEVCDLGENPASCAADCAASILCGNSTLDPGESCDGDCPVDCNDNDACTIDTLTGSAAGCTATCIHEPLIDCTSDDGCCPAGCTAATDGDCSEPDRCGNSRRDPGESCDGDCPVDCDDNDACTIDTLTGSAADCDATCIHEAVTNCAGGDDCCPPGCNADTDADCTAADSNFRSKKIITDIWEWATPDLSGIISRIDRAIAIGADTYKIGLSYNHSAYITGVKNGKPDYVAQGIAYAHSKGINFHLKTSLDDYASAATSSERREKFKTDTSAQNSFYGDITWIMQRYPTLDGFEHEEPHFYATETADATSGRNMTFLNDVFKRCKNIIAQYHSLTDGTFMYGMNTATNSDSGLRLIGIDVAYIRDKGLINYYNIQNPATKDLNNYKSIVATWLNRFPAKGQIAIVTGAALRSSGTSTRPECSGDYGNDPDCWDQYFFDKIKWAYSTGYAVNPWSLDRMATPRSLWPNDTTPGKTAGDKLKNIWGTISPCPSLFPLTEPGH